MVEPHLQPVTGEKFILTSTNIEDGARLDISANGFWGGRCEKTYIDVKVFNPHAPSNRTTNSKAIYRKHELCKKRSYDARIREVEHSSFTPLIFSATGGMAAEATVFYKRLASLLSDKWDSNYQCSCHGVGMLLFVFLTSAVSNKMFERIKIIQGLFWSLFGDSTNRSYTDGDQAAVTLAVTVDFLIIMPEINLEMYYILCYVIIISYHFW